MDPVVQGALVSGGVAVVLQLIHWGIERTRGQRDEQRAAREFNEVRLDELREVLEGAALALQNGSRRLHESSRTAPRPANDNSYEEYLKAMDGLSEWQTRLAVRLGQTDPIVEAFIASYYGMNTPRQILERLHGPRTQEADLPDHELQALAIASSQGQAGLVSFEHRAAAVIGPMINEREPRGATPSIDR
jgi:hypothetical protein